MGSVTQSVGSVALHVVAGLQLAVPVEMTAWSQKFLCTAEFLLRAVSVRDTETDSLRVSL